MKFGSVCSGIEAASVAWEPLGWSPQFFAENDQHPSRVLARRFPGVPNFGDMNEFRKWPEASVDVLAGGTPCQSFSVAGLRAGLDDPRGNLALVYLAIAERYNPDWLVWENVTGVLSSNGGRDFGSFIGALVRLGYSPCWRVFDAQYFGVPQRRRRVFLVANLRDWRLAASVLFEPESLQRNPPPRRGARQSVAPDVAKSIRGNSGGIDREDMHTLIPDVANPLTARMHKGINTTADEGQTAIVSVHGTQDPDVLHDTAHTLGRNSGQENAVAFKPSHFTRGKDGAPAELTPPLSADADKGDQDTLVFDPTQITHPENRSNPQPNDPAHTLAAEAKPPALVSGLSVRRLTPLECERLQGFPDGWTKLPKMSDTARYRMLGNSMAVPVMRWLGQRIENVTRTIK